MFPGLNSTEKPSVLKCLPLLWKSFSDFSIKGRMTLTKWALGLYLRCSCIQFSSWNLARYSFIGPLSSCVGQEEARRNFWFFLMVLQKLKMWSYAVKLHSNSIVKRLVTIVELTSLSLYYCQGRSWATAYDFQWPGNYYLFMEFPVELWRCWVTNKGLSLFKKVV